jgi:transcriptional regulator with XRE-family HTH domain
MNTIEIGKYIRKKRIEMHLTQKELAEKLNISFQAISKWETGTTLPDTAILLELSDNLEVTVDQILNAGEFRIRMNKNINVEQVQNAVKSILEIKDVLGANSSIYKSMLAGLNDGEDENFEDSLLDPKKREIITAKSCVELIIDGYNLKDEDIDNHFSSDNVKAKLKKYKTKYNQA